MPCAPSSLAKDRMGARFSLSRSPRPRGQNRPQNALAVYIVARWLAECVIHGFAIGVRVQATVIRTA